MRIESLPVLTCPFCESRYSIVWYGAEDGQEGPRFCPFCATGVTVESIPTHPPEDA